MSHFSRSFEQKVRRNPATPRERDTNSDYVWRCWDAFPAKKATEGSLKGKNGGGKFSSPANRLARLTPGAVQRGAREGEDGSPAHVATKMNHLRERGLSRGENAENPPSQTKSMSQREKPRPPDESIMSSRLQGRRRCPTTASIPVPDQRSQQTRPNKYSRPVADKASSKISPARLPNLPFPSPPVRGKTRHNSILF